MVGALETTTVVTPIGRTKKLVHDEFIFASPLKAHLIMINFLPIDFTLDVRSNCLVLDKSVALCAL